MIAAIVIHIFSTPTIAGLFYCLLFGVYCLILTVTEFKVNKIGRKNQQELNRDFTIEKHDKKE